MSHRKKEILAVILALLSWAFFAFVTPRVHFLPPLVFNLLSMSLDVITAGFIFFLCRHKLAKEPLRRSLLSSLLLFLALFALNNLFGIVYRSYFPALTPSTFGSPTVQETSNLLSGIQALLISPLTEEIVFRLCLLGAISSFVRTPFALVLSSLVFAFAHLYRADFVAMPIYFIIGMSLGFCYTLLGFRWAIAFHFLTNLFAHVLIPHGYMDNYAFSKFTSALMLTGLLYSVFLMARYFKTFLFRTKKT